MLAFRNEIKGTRTEKRGWYEKYEVIRKEIREEREKKLRRKTKRENKKVKEKIYVM